MKNLIFKQLFESESGAYTYLLGDNESKEAIIIDPVKETFLRDLNLIKKLNLKLKYILDTHVHADHITSSAKMRTETGAKIGISKMSGAKGADLMLSEGVILEFGKFKIKVLETPGHTNGCLSYVVENMVFTGDTLLIHSVGRTDFQEGSPEKLYNSLMKLFKLDDDFIVYPGHNYNGISNSSIGEEKVLNNFIGNNISKDDFINLVNRRELPLPKKIKESVPLNLNCGEE